MKLTDKEFTALTGIDNSEYGDGLFDAIWAWSIADNCDLPSRTIPGVVASLHKKGLVHCSDSGKDAAIGMTDAGARVYIKECKKRNHPVKKWLPENFK